MADDIDIEEHDVLDNPRIKTIFPDLTKIKKEIPDPDIDEDQFEIINEGGDFEQTSFRHSIKFENEDVEYTRHNNKIILGSKPNQGTSYGDYQNSQSFPVFGTVANTASFDYTNVRVKEEMPDYEDTERQTPGSVVLLGSVTSHDDTNYEGKDIDQEEILDSVVELEDWGPRLQRSSCYCKDCEILFPTRNCIDAHKMSAHSFLVAVNVNKAKKSTSVGADFKNLARKSTGMITKNTARKHTGLSPKNVRKSISSDPKMSTRKSTGDLNVASTSNAKFCNHCSKIFPDQATLINHLYDILTSNKFKCSECDSVFNKESELKLHAESHKSLNAEESEDDGDDGTEFFRCNICGCHFKRFILYNKHMYGHHLIKDPNIAKVNFQRKCLLCSNTYKNSKNQNRHIQEAHSKMNNKKMSPSKIVKQDSQATSVTHINPQISHTLIPKSVLFKCHQCQIHFTNLTAAILHSASCLKFKGDWKCHQCRRVFKYNDKITHLHQHSITDKFTVHLANKSMNSTLCLCPDCNSYFDESDFQKHCLYESHSSKRIICTDCSLPIHVSSIKTHKQCHSNSKKTKTDFILVEYVKIPNSIAGKISAPMKIPKRKISDSEDDYEETPKISVPIKIPKRKISDSKDDDEETPKISAPIKIPKRKISDPKNDDEETPSKKSKSENQVKYYQKDVLYYCTRCECYMRMSQHTKTHIASLCKIKECRKAFCKLCGLQHGGSINRSIHANGEKIHDFTFIRLQDKKVINPLVPTYPSCKQCNVHFLNKVALGGHECKDVPKTCKYCKLKFSDLAYSLHIQIHEYSVRRTQNKPTENVTSTPKKTQDLPELLKKYEMFVETWNILFLCQFCDIVCDSYDKVVEHCQNHYNKMESYDMTIKECRMCNLKFDGTCFDKHKELHVNPAIGKSSFTILKYSYLNLLRNEWYELFGSLPEGQVDQIVSRSIYKSCRNIKMRVTKDGPPELSLYKCHKCHKYMSSDAVAKHCNSLECSTETPGFVCHTCRRTFTTRICCQSHKRYHKFGKFRTIVFNKISDAPFNNALNCNELEQSHTTEVLETLPKTHPFCKEIGKDNPLYTYFKCKICECCILHKESVRDHNCNSPSTKRRCTKCGLWFVIHMISNHLKLHRIVPKFYKRNIKVILFNPKSSARAKIGKKPAKVENKDNNIAKIYKCQCGLHLTSSKTVEKHLEVCSPTYKVSKVNCGQCGLLFPTNLLVSHLCSHHSNLKITNFEIEEVSPQNKTSLKCGYCKQAFLKRHELLKHSLKCSLKQKSKVPKVTVYKCTQCDIHYMSTESLRYHYNINHKIREATTCKLCGLKFSQISLKKHQLHHHTKLKCTREDISVKVTDPTVKTTCNNMMRRLQLKKKVLSTIDVKLYNKNLFKCAVCKHHFLGRRAFYSHTMRMKSLQYHVKFAGTNCSICGLSFSLQTLPRHIYVHHDKLKLNREDFNIITDVYEDRKRSRTSFGKDNEEDNADASEAESVASDFNENHKNKKLGETLSKKIVKAKTSIPDKISNKRSKLIKNLPKRRADIIYNNILYKCEICPLIFLKSRSLQYHMMTDGHRKNGYRCSQCGLLFSDRSISRHKSVHHDLLKLKRKDFLIYCGLSTNIIHEPVTDTVAKTTNTHNDDDLNLLEDSNLDPEESMSEMKVDGNKHKDMAKRSVSDVDMLNPALTRLNISKYNEFLYNCTKCGIHFLSLDTLKRHSSPHRYVKTRVKCDICGYFFSTHLIIRHKYVHHDKLNLTFDDLRIVNENDIEPAADSGDSEDEKYSKDKDIDDTSSVNTKDLYINSEEDEAHGNEVEEAAVENNVIEETSQEIYKLSNYTRSKIDLSLYDNYLYKCLKCSLHFIMCGSLVKHKQQCFRQSKTSCPECGLVFTYHTLARHRYIHHEQLGLKLENFFIVTTDNMNKITIISGNEDTQDKLRPNNDLHKNLGTSFTYDIKSVDNILNKSTSEDKDAESESEDENIISNNEVTSKENNTRSTTDSLESFNLDDINSIENASRLSETTQTSNSSFNLYKCSRCSIHFLDQTSLNTHVLSSSHNGSKNDCSFCGFKFSNRTIQRHVYLHHEVLKLTCKDFNIIYEDANKKDEVVVSQSTNSSVDLNSSSDKTIDIDDPTNNTKKSVVKLYKCGKCNVYFVAQVTCYKHVAKHKNLDSKEYIECKLCGLQFRITSLYNHVSVHHSEEFNLENVLIEEYHPVVNGTPKIDIYYAVDKVQSKLVSTTSEKDVADEELDTASKNADTNDYGNVSENKIVTDGVDEILEVTSQNHDIDTTKCIEINEEKTEPVIVEDLGTTKSSTISQNRDKLGINAKDTDAVTMNSDNSDGNNVIINDSENNLHVPPHDVDTSTPKCSDIVDDEETREAPVEKIKLDTNNSDIVARNQENIEQASGNTNTAIPNIICKHENNLQIIAVGPTNSNNMDNKNEDGTESIRKPDIVEIQNNTDIEIDAELS